MNIAAHLFTFNELKKYSKGVWKNTNNCELNSIDSISTDTRSNCKNSLFLALSGINFDAHNFLNKAVSSGASALCLEKGKYNIDNLPSNLPILEVRSTLKAYQDIARNYRLSLGKLTLIAITGSNGKTSVKEILKDILSQEFGEDVIYVTKANTNNHIGVPLNILNIRTHHKYAIIELGTNHPGEIDVIASIAAPDIAIITSIASSHLEFFKNLNGVAEEKSNILKYFHPNKNGNLTVIPIDILKYKLIKNKLGNVKYMTFDNSDKSSDLIYKYISTDVKNTSFSLKWKNCQTENFAEWKIPGKHQISNAAAVALTASFLGISHDKICRYFAKCKLSGMRMKINKIQDTFWVNDAYNANPASTKAGLEYMSDIIKTRKFSISYIVLGDMLEIGDDTLKSHYEIIKQTENLLPDSIIILIGDSMRKALFQIDNFFTNNNRIKHFKNTEDIAGFLKINLKKNDIIYLKGSRGMKLEMIEKSFLNKP